MEPTPREEQDPSNLSDEARELAALKKSQPIDPEIIAWALRNIDETEIAAELEEIRLTGGLRFSDFEAELERIARG